MSLKTLKLLMESVDKGDDKPLVPVTIGELHSLILATEILRMVAADMLILKGVLRIARGHNMARKTDKLIESELDEMVCISIGGLTPLKAEDLAAEDIGAPRQRKYFINCSLCV